MQFLSTYPKIFLSSVLVRHFSLCTRIFILRDFREILNQISFLLCNIHSAAYGPAFHGEEKLCRGNVRNVLENVKYLCLGLGALSIILG